MTNYELAKIDYENGLSTKEIADNYSVSMATVRKWKSRYQWCDVTKKRDIAKKKRIKEQAKEMIIAGASIRETSEKIGLPKSTVGDISSKYNLQAKQLDYLKEFRDKQRERILQNKLKRLEINEEALEAICYEVMNWKETGRISKSLMEKLIMNEELEQNILELDRIERMEKLELEREKAKLEDKDNQPAQVVIVDDIGSDNNVEIK